MLVGNIAVWGQANVPKRIYIKGADINVTYNVDAWLNEHSKVEQSKLLLIRFSKLPSTATKLQLKEHNIFLKDYIPDNAYVVLVDQSSKLEVLKNAYAYYIQDYSSLWKIDERLKGYEGNTDIIVSLYAAGDKIAFLNALNNIDIVQVNSNWEQLNKFVFSITKDQVVQLAELPEVQYISPLPKDVLLNAESKNASKTSNASLAKIHGGLGLTGKGIVIGVGDNVSGMSHIDLKDRVINYNPAAYTDHGVHINGIVGGAGIMDPRGEGVAPEATLVDHFFSNVLTTTPDMYQAHGMTITNNSYASTVGSCSYSGVYDALSVSVDELANNYNDILHVFASGNDGYLNCSPYPDGFGTVTGGYQPAKNNIVVNSTNKWFVNAYDGSRGPVRDGRLKPEITAVGVEVNSTTKNEEYLVAAGTSMASPGVAGAAALLAERYKQLHNNTNPKSDVLKTLLLNGATDIGNPGPDYRFGFGFLNLQHAITMLDSNRYSTNTITNGAAQQMKIDVPANTAKLKIMLCWHDKAANPSSSKQLINDLDLEVTEPNNTVHLPMVLDETPANILKNAIEKRDRLNNCEQVIINNPAAGSYTISVKGFNIPSTNQQYVIAYDFEQEGVEITYPTKGAAVKGEDSLRIYWYASDNANSFTLEYTTDGNTWTVIDNNIDAAQRYYVWYVPAGINSANCSMRLTRNTIGQVSTVGAFVINKQPEVKLSTNQCPGYIAIEWGAINNATSYEILQKLGANLVAVDTVNATSYIFKGLDPNKYQYVAVRPILGSLSGYRSLAIKRLPNDGDCTGSISDNDLSIDKVFTPVSGRMFTSTELKNNAPVILNIRNLDDVANSNYRVSYSINNGAWQSQIFTDAIPAKSIKAVTLTTANLAAAGSYSFRFAVENLTATDPVRENDSVTKVVRQLNNAPININNGFSDGFETMGIINISNDSMGVSTNEHWDYYNDSDTGRFRSFVNNGITISGNRSITMDAYKDVPLNKNEFVGTFNIANTSAASTEVRLEFDYILHGLPKEPEGNDVWVRGSDAGAWQKVYSYNNARKDIGLVQNSGTISVSDALLKSSQDFTTSFQLKFSQQDTTSIALRNFGTGVTIDNMKLYTVQNDVALEAIVAPAKTGCDRSSETPLTITIRNGVNIAQNNVDLYYRINNGAPVKETLATIAGKATVNYTFNKKLDISAVGTYALDVWLVANGDTYLKNDSILNTGLRNQPFVKTFPYKEDFEQGTGGWYADGINSSWEYGVPTAPKISKAYSGTKAWVTSLSSSYNDNELSHLYSPCFDVSTIENPTFSCRIALDIENCGQILCDAGYFEYSIDGGLSWSKLDTGREMTNWYNDTSYKIWTVQNETDWREAVISLPKGASLLNLRFTMFSDPAAHFEGIGVDDIMIFDRKYYLPTNDIISLSPNPTNNHTYSIEWAASVGAKMQIVMTDIMGRQVYTTTAIASEEGYNRTTILTPQMSRGVYLLRIVIAGKEHQRKIVYQ
ncbi:MAG: S8 family peptidase [Flavipsychrobacter sp.]